MFDNPVNFPIQSLALLLFIVFLYRSTKPIEYKEKDPIFDQQPEIQQQLEKNIVEVAQEIRFKNDLNKYRKKS